MNKKKAIALRYDAKQNRAPQVIAAGEGLLALRILKAAQESGIPFFRHEDLAAALFAVPVGAEIPVELYELTAHILAFILKADQKTKQGQKKGGRL